MLFLLVKVSVLALTKNELPPLYLGFCLAWGLARALLSYFLDEPLTGYWLRQCAIMIYVAAFVAVVGCMAGGNNANDYKLALLYGAVIAIGTTVAVTFPSAKVESYPSLVVLALPVFSIFIVRSGWQGALLWSVGLVCLVAVVSNQSSFLIAAVLSSVSAVLWKAHSKLLIGLAVAFGALIAIAFLGSQIDGDVNLQWRLSLWAQVVDRVFSSLPAALWGHGFGIPFIDVDTAIGWSIVSQVSSLANPWDVQRFLVVPHNAWLTIILHMGVPYALVVVGGICILVVNGYKSNAWQAAGLSSGIIGQLVILSLNQGIEVPYVAVIFWSCLGCLYAILARPGSRDT